MEEKNLQTSENNLDNNLQFDNNLQCDNNLHCDDNNLQSGNNNLQSVEKNKNDSLNESEKNVDFEDPELVETQLKFCSSLITRMKRNSNVGPFLLPVDPVALGIPDYFEKIHHPMDISTIRNKLDRRTAISKIPNSDSYKSAKEFYDDVKLIFSNCYLYNGYDAQVSLMGRELEKLFDNLYVDLPTEIPKKISKKSSEDNSNVKRAKSGINSTTNSPLNNPSSQVSIDAMAVIKELEKSRYRKTVWPFQEPVDPIEVPGYTDIITNPMDLSTIKMKINDYSNFKDFESDLQLIVDNCKLFNAENTEIYKIGLDFESLCKKILDDIIYHTGPSVPQTRRTLDSEIEDLRRKISDLKSKLTVLEQSKAHSTGKKIFTINDREEIGRQILNLPKAETDRVADIIQRNCSSFNYAGNDEIEVNMHMLPDYVLCEIEDFLKRVDKKDIIDAASDSVE